MNDKWWQKQLSIADIILPFSDEMKEFNAEKFAKALKNLNFNCQHLGISTLHYGEGGEDACYYFKTYTGKEWGRDFLGEYIKYAKKYGINVLVYVNVHWFTNEFVSNHEDWMEKDKNGVIIHIDYGIGGIPCINSPFRDWSINLIKDIAEYDIKGIFLDGPFFKSRCCYCKYCQEKFQKNHNQHIPEIENISKPLWRKFIEFKSDSIARYIRDVRQALKEKKPDAIIYMNGEGLIPSRSYGRDNRKLIVFQDILGAEGGFLNGDLREVPIFKPGATAKLLETQASGKPTVVFLAGRHQPWTRYLHTEAETKLLFAQTVANGANIWYGIYIKNINESAVKAAGEINKFLSKNSKYFEGTKSIANVALLWSNLTANYYNISTETTDFGISKSSIAGDAGNFTKAFWGYYETLVRNHIPFDVIDEVALTQDILNKYEVLILPDCACLSEENVKSIEKYVSKGGNLISTFDTSLFDAFGSQKKNFQLKEVFGVSYEKSIKSIFHDYIILKDRKNFFGTSIKSLLPTTKYSLKVKETTAKPLAYFLEHLTTRYSSLTEDVSHGAIFLNRYGNGQCLYFSGTFDEDFYEYHFIDYLSLLGNSVKKLSHQIVKLENAPSSVEVILRETKDNILIHLINFTGEMTRPIKNIIPISNIKITVNKKMNIKKVTGLMYNKRLNVIRRSRSFTIALPVLCEYEVIVVEKTD